MGTTQDDMIAELQCAVAELRRESHERGAERDAALAREAALAEVLDIINRSPGDPQPVFESILDKARALCGAEMGTLANWDGEYARVLARHGYSEEIEAVLLPFGQPFRPGSLHLPVLREGKVVHIVDAAESPLRQDDDKGIRAFVERSGTRTWLSVPLRGNGAVIGSINVARGTVRAFSDAEISLLQSFAAQAVIAMENARLLNETREALERQTATAEVLQAINASPGNLPPVFDAVLEKAMRLCGAAIGGIYSCDGSTFEQLALRGVTPAFATFAAEQPLPTPTRGILAWLLANKTTQQIPDLVDTDGYRDGTSYVRALVGLGGIHAILDVPLLKEGEVVGMIAIYREAPGAFPERQIALLEDFAAQAVIAMENARLLGELRDRTTELAERNAAFAERIDHQAATIDVLKTMSASPGNPQPVFELIVQQARSQCNSQSAFLFQYDGLLHCPAAVSSVHSDEEMEAYRSHYPRELDPDPESGLTIAIRDGRIAHMRDDESERGISAQSRALGTRSGVVVPMIRDGVAAGCIALGSTVPGGFTDSQIELLKTFAEQAVIAIQSAETYRALQERTAALAQRNSEFGERIEQQAATIDVLKVMSSTPDDTQPVFDQIVRRAKELCNSNTAVLLELRDGLVDFCAHYSDRDFNTPAFASYLAQYPMAPTRGSMLGRAILDSEVIHIKDIEAEPGLSPAVRALIKDGNYRSQVTIPLMRDGQAIGCISLTGVEPGGFTDSQVSLLHTFAEQAVIAITSVANFRALRERTAELTRSVAELQALEEVMRAVNSSLDVDTVLETIISRAVTLSQADEGTIYEYDDAEEVFVLKATHGMSETRVSRLREARIKLGDTYLGRAGLQREPVHVSDLQLDPTLPETTKEALHDIHAVLAVPLLREDKVLGGLVIRRRTTGDFPATIPTLLQTFASQSVLAIENARLFQDARRARLAAEATLTDLRRTQDRLVQTEKMASLGQLTAGIAHEIKNPLNFVNNFSDLSVDLLNELNEAVAPDRLTVADDLRAEIDEITATLKGNLERIAQHGRRADSIVKNMLLHSRTGPSEHREIDLNATVEEALNLAYHGARAETPGFNITLEKHLDPAAGTIDAFPQEITRVMLNLMSNGFYAARKRMATAPPGFEPTLIVSTASHGDSVTISVRDNGTGMPDSVRDKIFEPFFTTKPAGEGTGLGLSLSFDIVVKQHGGQLTVDSEPDNFTEFTVTLPRRVAAGATP